MLKMIKNLLWKYKVYVKYIISGGTGALVNFISLFVFTEFAGLHYLSSAILAFFVSVAISFNLQKRWTFRNNDRSVARQAMKFLIITGSNLVLDTILLYWLVDIMGMWYMLAQFFIYGGLAIFSFLLYRFIVFREAAAGPADVPDLETLSEPGNVERL